MYVVWLPVMEGDREAAATEAAGRIADPRARHFWNPDNAMPREVARALKVQDQLDLAWDVFLLYAPEASWSGPTSFPAPSAWLHALAEEDPRWMTPEKLGRAIRALLPPSRPARPTPRPR